MDWTLKFLIFFEACILIGAAALVWKAYKSMRRVCKNKDTEIEYLRYTVKHLQEMRLCVDDLTMVMNQYLGKSFTDKNGTPIHIGDMLVNEKGMEFMVKYGVHKMFCPVENIYKDTVGVYCTCNTYSLEAFPLGRTHEWATIK